MNETQIEQFRQLLLRVVELLENLVKQGEEITRLSEDVESIKKRLNTGRLATKWEAL